MSFEPDDRVPQPPIAGWGSPDVILNIEKDTAHRLYSSRQVSLAAFIGSPVAACWCIAWNYRHLEKPGSAKKWLIWGCGGSFVLLTVFCLLPFAKQIPHYIIPLAYSLTLREVAQRLQGDAVARHLSAGGRLASWWLVLGISVLFLIGVLAALVAILFFCMPATPDPGLGS